LVKDSLYCTEERITKTLLRLPPLSLMHEGDRVKPVMLKNDGGNEKDGRL
jgi:hypothetical protein